MSELTLQDLLEAGAHFGHQTKRWNPKMKRYILCARNGVYIIDVEKTLQGLNSFLGRVKEEVSKGGKVLFVGTKKQIKDCIREEATRCRMPYVCERWLGGMLTNFQTIRQSIKRLEKIEAMETDGTMQALTKKEALSLQKKKTKLLTVLSGIRNIRRLPAVVFVVDTIKEHIAVAEARRLRIPLGAIVDTNCDPDEIDYVIPGNDDALKSVQLIAKAVADTILENATTVDVTAAEGESFQEASKEEREETVIEELEETTESEEIPLPARRPRVVRRRKVEIVEED